MGFRIDRIAEEMLPGAQAALFTVTAIVGGLDAASIAVLDLRSGRPTVLLRGGRDAHYAAWSREMPQTAHYAPPFLAL